MRNVGFQYDANAPMVLYDISCVIEPGQKVAIIGPTGSGKSTLALLLLGLYQPTHGEILYDGIPLNRFNYRNLRSQFGVVMQQSLIFSGSIRQNISMGRPDVNFERVVEAARMAVIDEDIEQMPMKYETFISEGGSNLSGGQRQRLSIARALVHKPNVLLLDEATSHLDVQTETEVDRNLSDLSCTRIVIAHRLSTIRNSDLILVLDQGRISERGGHEELLMVGGQYAELVKRQLASDSDETLSGGGYERRRTLNFNRTSSL